MQLTFPNIPELTEKEKERHNTVIKANELIQKSRFSLSTQQQKILLYLISKINPFDDDFKLYEFKVAEFCDICGIDYNHGNIYELIKEQIKKIADKSLWVNIDNETETLLRWIEKPYINKKSGTIKIKLDKDMKPFLLQLNRRYTEYELIYTLNFKSRYSIRLYEYIKSIHYNNLEPYTQRINIDELKLRLDSNYQNFKDFHTRVLKPATTEINKYTDISVEYELITEKRKVIAVIFHIEPQDALQRYQNIGQLHLLLDKKGDNINGK